VAGVTSGLLEPGNEVTWQARHLGMRWHLTSRITAFDRPHHFRDEMVRGPFARLVHDHRFELTPAGTTMTDEFDYALPWGWLGELADRVAVHAHLRRFLVRRAHALKEMAEKTVHGHSIRHSH